MRWYERHPPEFLLIEAALGYKPKSNKPGDFIAAVLAMGGKVTVGGQVLSPDSR